MNFSKNKFYSLLFAGDLCAFKIYKKSGKNTNICIQNYLKSIENWLKLWRLTMAPQKCNNIVFTANMKNDISKEIVR